MRIDAATDVKKKRFSRVRITTLLFATFILLVLSSFSSILSAAEKPSYIIAVVPQQPPVTMYTNWMPFVEQLMKETGEKIKLKVYETMSEFEHDYARGVPDLLYANPTQTVIARKRQGYIPLVRNAKPIAGIVFVRNDSAVKSIKDLKNQDIAFVGSKNI